MQASPVVLDDLARPFMRAWYRSRESALAAVPFPADAPVARVPGADPVRVLLLGNGAATGWGVRSHDLALTGRLAEALAEATGRGVQVDARIDSALRLGGLARLLDDVPLRRYSAVVLVVGDLSADPRFAETPAVQGEQGLRFSVGYPIESPDGYRIGALCILDSSARDSREIDTEALSDLPLLAQELRASVERGDRTAP